MKIEFLNDYYICPKTFELSFYVLVDSKERVCKVPYDTLLKLDVENSLETLENIYQLNQESLEELAKKKIVDGNKDILISNEDIK